MDCHGRLPMNLTSSFQNGEQTVNTSKLKDPYEVGLAFLIVRRIVDAKDNFRRSIQDKIISKDSEGLILPFQQILLIETKIKKNPTSMISIIDDYIAKDNLPKDISLELRSWKKRLLIWSNEKAVTQKITTETQLKEFIQRRLLPLKTKDSFNDAFKVDLLLASGIISHYFFENQDSQSAPELSMWLGFIEKRLKKEDFMGTGDLFLKQCIRKYPHHPIAKECFKEYKESVLFDFTGSRGTEIPTEVNDELEELNKKILEKKK